MDTTGSNPVMTMCDLLIVPSTNLFSNCKVFIAAGIVATSFDKKRYQVPTYYLVMARYSLLMA